MVSASGALVSTADQYSFPYNWAPRQYQQPVWAHLLGGIRDGLAEGFKGIGPRAVCVWHRRAGKDAVALNFAATASQIRPGNYAHVLPSLRQGRKVVWEGKDREGQPMLTAFPRRLHARQPRDDEMTIWMRTPSETDRFRMMGLEPREGAGVTEGLAQWQVLGSDRYDALRGGNYFGVVFSEYAWQDPMAWQVVSPILAENGGWAMFISTANGMNHFYDMYESALQDDHWFCEKLTVDDTKRPDGSAVVSEEMLAQERKNMSPVMFDQEYRCSFAAGMEGALYAEQMADAVEDERIRDVPWEPSVDVWTWWDLGMGDATAIWFVQHVHQEIRVIDYLEDTGKGLTHYAKRLKEKKYCYGGHVMPHDIKVRELGTGKSRKEIAESLGLRPITVAPKLSIEDGVEAVRATIPRCYFDKTKCKRGLAALRQYRTEWQPEKNTFTQTPVHDWTSHPADAFRYGSLTLRRQKPMIRRPIKVRSKVLAA